MDATTNDELIGIDVREPSYSSENLFIPVTGDTTPFQFLKAPPTPLFTRWLSSLQRHS